MIVRIVGNNLAGGARRYCYLLNQYISSQNLDTITFIPKAPIEDPYSDQDKVSPLKYKNTRNWPIVFLFILKNRKKISYIHLHLRNASIIFSPILKALKIPYIITVHSPLQDINSLKQLVICKAYAKALLSADLVIFISDFVKKDILNGLKLEQSSFKHKTIHNGSEPPKDNILTKILDKDSINICIVGELTFRKGINKYREIFSYLNTNHYKIEKKINFNFYGEGPLKPVLENNIREYHNQKININILGYEQDLDRIYTRNELHLILSHNEAFGRVLTEAMAYGVPTITKPLGAFPEIVTNGHNGFLIDTELDIAKMLISISNGEIDLQPLSQNCKKIFKEKFSNEISASQTFSAIQRAIKK